MKPGTYNVLKTAPIVRQSGDQRFYQTRNERLMLGVSVDKETAETYLERYRARYPSMSFELVDDAPATTTDVIPGIGRVVRA